MTQRDEKDSTSERFSFTNMEIQIIGGPPAGGAAPTVKNWSSLVSDDYLAFLQDDDDVSDIDSEEEWLPDEDPEERWESTSRGSRHLSLRSLDDVLNDTSGTRSRRSSANSFTTFFTDDTRTQLTQDEAADLQMRRTRGSQSRPPNKPVRTGHGDDVALPNAVASHQHAEVQRVEQVEGQEPEGVPAAEEEYATEKAGLEAIKFPPYNRPNHGPPLRPLRAASFKKLAVCQKDDDEEPFKAAATRSQSTESFRSPPTKPVRKNSRESHPRLPGSVLLQKSASLHSRRW